MRENMKKSVLLLSLLAVMVASASAKKPVYVHIVGDETAAEMTAMEDMNDSAAIGWGQVLRDYVSDIEVINRAVPATTSRALLTQGDWNDIIANASRGSILLIQLGHHEYDEANGQTYSTLVEFENNLLMMVETAQKKKLRVVLLTPTTKRFFYDNEYYPRHGAYAEGVRRVAQQQHLPLIDVEAMSRENVADAGEDASAVYFAAGKDVELSEEGARMVARYIAEQAKELKIKGLYTK